MKRLLLAVGAALSIILSVLFVAQTSRISISHTQTESRASTFKLGALLCLSGECSEWGSNSLKGITLATEEINAEGGILGQAIALAVQDSKEASGGGNSVSGYRQLILDPEIHYIVGPTWSVGGLPIAPIVAKNRDILLTSPSVGVSKFNETGANLFNLWPHDSYATTGLAHFAIEHGFKRVAILSGNDPWVTTQGDTFENEFKRLGGEITVKIVINPDTRDIRAEALSIHRSAPDAVFYADTFNMSKVARELRTLQFTGAQLSILMDDTRIREARGALEATYFAMYPASSKEFQEHFFARFGVLPGVAADTAYDAVKLYAAAISEAKTFDPKVVGPTMLKMEHEGASGHIVFDEKGGVKRAPAFYKVRKNAFVKMETN